MPQPLRGVAACHFCNIRTFLPWGPRRWLDSNEILTDCVVPWTLAYGRTCPTGAHTSGLGKVTAMRAIVPAIIALMLGGCMQGTLAPATDAGWSGRDRQLMANLPYRQVAIPMEYRRQIVQYTRKEAPGTIVVDTGSRFLYYVLPKGQAIRYGITVGERGQDWSGTATV